MSIQEIKDQLNILSVLSHYGISLGRNKMISCPFHDDQKASMKIYTNTNTVYCFAGGCSVESLDVIDFILKKENITKHQAIVKAASLLKESLFLPEKMPSQSPKMEHMENKQNPQQFFVSYRKSLQKSKNAQAYCERRALDWRQLDVAYKSQKTPDKWGRGCIIFPLRNAAGDIVSLYGRSILGQQHYYQSGRSGLYPAYPSPDTRRIILTESIIDAASLYQFKSITKDQHILALFGTNGLTSEHLKVLQSLPQLEEITFFMDGDQAGRQAVEKHQLVLQKHLPKVRLMHIVALENEDVNSILQAHDPSILIDMVARRKVLTSKEKIEKTATKQSIVTPAKQPQKRTFDSYNPNNLIFYSSLGTYYIKGGVRYGHKDLDSLKVTLMVENKQGKRSRNKLDMYEDKQVEKVARITGERLGLRVDMVELDLYHLARALEGYQQAQYEQQQKPQVPVFQIVPPAEKAKCLSFLKQKNLLQTLNEQLEKAGIVGEQNNRLLLFIVASAYKMRHTLHALIQGASGSGKTQLLRTISACMPWEDVKKYTRVTDGSFYNQPEYFFKNKLLCFEDIDGLKEDALLAVRELQSNEILITSTSIKDPNGSIRGGELIVRGPIGSISCTTKATLYEDNISRCFVLAVDESPEQDLRVIRYQNNKAAGLKSRQKEEDIQAFLQNCIRLIQPYEVVNPYANKIQLPPSAHKIRRLNELYQSFVRQLTLLHQYQRKKDTQGRLISEKQDLQLACDILFEAIVLKVDELDGSLRQFFEKLKKYVQSKGNDYEFNRFEIRTVTAVSKTQQHRYIKQLVDLEYLNQRGFANRGYRYKIAHWDNMSIVRQDIKNQLEQQLQSLS